MTSRCARATPPSRVNSATPLPYGLSLISASPSAYEWTRVTPSTGPKISSSYAFIPGFTSSSRLGLRKKPLSGAPDVPSMTTFAPSAGAFAT